MKRKLVGALKVAVPLGIGVWLIFWFYDQLDPQQREALFAAFRQADLLWFVPAVLVGWLAHVSRAWRWRLILEPLGHKPGFWDCYHAVMIGYFMNLFLPRAGEASRAVSLYRTEQVPFEQGFGTILAERAVDLLMLLGIAGITVLLQLEKYDLIHDRILAFRSTQQAAGPHPWAIWAGIAALGAMAVAGWLLWTRPAMRARLRDLVRGFLQGLQSVLRTRQRGAFLFLTVFIWAAYLAMFQIGFLALPGTAAVPLAGVLAGFVAGAVGIVLVQGGIGVYPAFVALIVSIYMAPVPGGGLIRPDALAMGWLLWAAQTLLIIVLGGLSLLLVAMRRTAR